MAERQNTQPVKPWQFALNPVQLGTSSFENTSLAVSYRLKWPGITLLMVDVEKWDQSAEQLRQLALRAKHPRSRERLMALYEIL